MLVRELMTSPATSLQAGSKLEAAIQVLATHHISSVPVVDASGQVVGTVSEADVLREGLPPDARAHLRLTDEPEGPWHRLVDDVMTVDPMTVTPDSDAARAAELLSERGWNSLPVVRDRQLVGVISRSDLIRSLATLDGEIAERIAQEFAEIGRDEWQVDVENGVVTLRVVAPGRETRLAQGIAETVPGVRRVQVHDAPEPAV